MHDPNPFIDKYYDVSLSFCIIDEEDVDDGKSTMASFPEKKKKKWCRKTRNDRSIDWICLRFFFLSSPFFL